MNVSGTLFPPRCVVAGALLAVDGPVESARRPSREKSWVKGPGDNAARGPGQDLTGSRRPWPAVRVSTPAITSIARARRRSSHPGGHLGHVLLQLGIEGPHAGPHGVHVGKAGQSDRFGVLGASSFIHDLPPVTGGPTRDR